jgi:hypothetical protein
MKNFKGLTKKSMNLEIIIIKLKKTNILSLKNFEINKIYQIWMRATMTVKSSIFPPKCLIPAALAFSSKGDK